MSTPYCDQPCHAIVYTSNNRFSAKLVINAGQSGPLKTISPEFFFDIIADGCIVYP